MADAKHTAPLVTTFAPAPTEVPDDVKAGEGEVVVTSPAGTRSVVEKHHVDTLKAQGYKVGS